MNVWLSVEWLEEEEVNLVHMRLWLAMDMEDGRENELIFSWIRAGAEHRVCVKMIWARDGSRVQIENDERLSVVR